MDYVLTVFLLPEGGRSEPGRSWRITLHFWDVGKWLRKEKFAVHASCPSESRNGRGNGIWCFKENKATPETVLFKEKGVETDTKPSTTWYVIVVGQVAPYHSAVGVARTAKKPVPERLRRLYRVVIGVDNHIDGSVKSPS